MRPEATPTARSLARSLVLDELLCIHLQPPYALSLGRALSLALALALSLSFTLPLARSLWMSYCVYIYNPYELAIYELLVKLLEGIRGCSVSAFVYNSTR